MRPKAALFDWDGTLVNSAAIAHLATCEVLADYGCPPVSKETHHREITKDYVAFYRRYGVPESVSRAELDDAFKKHFLAMRDMVHLQPGAERILQECRARDMHIAIVSANVHGVIVHLLRKFGILRWVDWVEAGAIVKREEIRTALRHFGLAAPEAFHVDDTFEGISAANEAGVISVATLSGIDSRERLQEADPDHIISSLDELPERLNFN